MLNSVLLRTYHIRRPLAVTQSNFIDRIIKIKRMMENCSQIIIWILAGENEKWW